MKGDTFERHYFFILLAPDFSNFFIWSMLFKNIIGLDGPILIPLPTNTQAAMNEKKRICNSEEMGNP